MKKIDSSMLEEVKVEYEKMYKNFYKYERDVKHSMNAVVGVVRFENGMMIVFNKPTIQLANDEGLCSEATKREYFLRENLKPYEKRLESIISNPSLYMFQKPVFGTDGKEVTRLCLISEKKGAYANYAGELTDNDKRNLLAEIKRLRDKFRKRLVAWWKRNCELSD